MRKRGLCCRQVSVRRSVHHVGVLYPAGWRYRQTFVRSGSPTILVFLTPSDDTQFQGEPLQRWRKIQGGGTNLRFSREIAVYHHITSAAVGLRGSDSFNSIFFAVHS